MQPFDKILGRGAYRPTRKQRIRREIISYIIAIVIVLTFLIFSVVKRKIDRNEARNEALSARSQTIEEPFIEPSDYSSEQTEQTVVAAQTEFTATSFENPALDNEYDLYADLLDFCESISVENQYEPIVVNNNVPSFVSGELRTVSFEDYMPLDASGRAGCAIACLSSELMPTEDRNPEINVDPSGWHSVPAEDVENGWLYNRCHLIAYCLTAENDNAQNFVTGTRNMNVEEMLPYEEAVAEVLDEYPNLHIMYRVSPIFIGDNLVCNGVLMEAYSVEDNGNLVCFCVYCPNTQPGWQIDYATGFADPV